jgi:hypothetical protein
MERCNHDFRMHLILKSVESAKTSHVTLFLVPYVVTFCLSEKARPTWADPTFCSTTIRAITFCTTIRATTVCNCNVLSLPEKARPIWAGTGPMSSKRDQFWDQFRVAGSGVSFGIGMRQLMQDSKGINLALRMPIMKIIISEEY